MTSRSIVLAGALLFFARSAAAQQSTDAVTLKITEESSSYVLTVPVSHLVMKIPKGDLVNKPGPRPGPGDSPRYFKFESQSALIISGWFESADGFKDIESFWRNETAAWKHQGLPKPKDVSFVHLGTWNAVLYDMATPIAKNTHIRAHWVQAGTWIDIHLSLTGDEPVEALRQKLRDVLQSISVTEKAS